jgi:hypothetical protein
MGKGIVGSIVAVILLAVVSLISVQMTLANETSIMVNVKAQANGNDIVVSGKVFLNGLEGKENISVDIRITIKGPNGDPRKATFRISGLSDGSGVTILPYEYTFKDCVNEKGIYEIEVTAKYKNLDATAYFKFDPPSGGTPGVPC